MALLKKARGALIVIGVLSALGTATLAVRLTLRGRQSGVPEGDTVWNLKCRVRLDARENAVLRIAIPADTANIRLFGHDFTTPGLRQVRSRGRGGIARDFTAIAYRAGVVSAEADFDLHMSPKPGWRPLNGKAEQTPEELMEWLKPEPAVQTEHELVTGTLREIRESKPKNQRALVRAIVDYCSQQISLAPELEAEDAVSALREREGSTLSRARALLALLRAAKVHARLVSGFILEERREAEPFVWVEALLERRWEPFDLEHGHLGKLPSNFLPVRRGGKDIVQTKDGEILDVEFTLVRRPVPRGMLSGEQRSPLQIFDMTRLPLVTQLSLATLLLLPLGALLTTFFRNMVGVRTFGTFSPTLLALAAVDVEWKTVTMIFTLVILIGVGGRALLPGFKLMQVPRLSIVFTLVAVSMMLSVSLLDYLGLNPTGKLTLLPMVVLTSLVDRVYSVADEDGMHVAGVRLGWTAGVGVVCFGMFLWKGLGHILLEFPELHFYTIAAMLVFGLYKGKKLCDVPAFRFLAEPKPEKPKIDDKNDKPADSAAAAQDVMPPVDALAAETAASPVEEPPGTTAVAVPGDAAATETTNTTPDSERVPEAPKPS